MCDLGVGRLKATSATSIDLAVCIFKLCAAFVFVGWPALSDLVIWLLTLLIVAIWSAFGSLLGGLMAKLAVRLVGLR